MSVGIGFYKITNNHRDSGFFDERSIDPSVTQNHGLSIYYGRSNYTGKFQGSGLHGSGYEPIFKKRGYGYGIIYGGNYQPPVMKRKLEGQGLNLAGQGLKLAGQGLNPYEMDIYEKGSGLKLEGEGFKQIDRPIRKMTKFGKGKKVLPGANLKNKLLQKPGLHSKTHGRGHKNRQMMNKIGKRQNIKNTKLKDFLGKISNQY